MAAAKGEREARRRSRARAVCILLVALSAVFAWRGGQAEAQELIRRQTFFERLFGGPPPREALPPPPGGAVSPRQQPSMRAPAQRGVPRRAPAVAAPAPEPAAPVIEKLDNAVRVLVVGDFLAAGLAEGLNEAYAESPGVTIVDRTNGSSGFVRDDFYDWNAEIGPILEGVEPAVAIVMIGSNDRQSLLVDGRSERPRTEAWQREYVRRVTAFAETIQDAGIPIIWVGLPPFRSQSMSSDMLAFNDMYKQAAEEVDGTFVDIWDGFADENGAFTFTGPDVNGQPVRLRGSDGINLTRPAKRKVAFYVEQPLNKLLGSAASPGIGREELANLPPPGMLAGKPGDLSRTAPISLAAPQLDGGDALMGATPLSPVDRSVPSAQPGRADDFRLP